MKRNVVIAAAIAAVVMLGGSSCEDTNIEGAQEAGQKQTEDAYQQLSAAVPYVPPANSLERKNLAERLKRTDDPNALGYVYLMNFGQIVGYYTVLGKVSSPDSQMTTSELVQNCEYRDSSCPVVVAPGDDGSYGPNEQGIFFFTTEGAMVTTSLDYIWADQPLPIDVPRLNAKE